MPDVLRWQITATANVCDIRQVHRLAGLQTNHQLCNLLGIGEVGADRQRYHLTIAHPLTGFAHTVGGKQCRA